MGENGPVLNGVQFPTQNNVFSNSPQTTVSALLAAAASGAGNRPVVNGVQFPTQNNVFASGNAGSGVTLNGNVQTSSTTQAQQQAQQQLDQLKNTPGYSDANPIIWRPSIYGGVYATNRGDIQGAIPFEQVAQYGYGVLDQNGYTVSLAEGKARFAEEEAKLQAILNQPQPAAYNGVSASSSQPTYSTNVTGQIIGSNGSSGTQPYIGNWVPEDRAQGIQQVGVEPEVLEMQRLNAEMLANPAQRYALMPQYLEQERLLAEKSANYQAELKALTEQSIRNNAQQLYENSDGMGSGGFGWGQVVAGQVLSNQAQSILGNRLGVTILPAGNALETLDELGLPYSDGLGRIASSYDLLNQYSYNPDNVYDPKLFGFGYNSMGMSGNNVSDVAWGGDGRQYAQEIYQEAELQNKINANQNRWNTVMANSTPGGTFIGGGPNVVSTGVQGRIVGGGDGPTATPHYSDPYQSVPNSARQMTDWELFRQRALQMGNTDPGETPYPGWQGSDNINRLNDQQYQQEYGTYKLEPLGALNAMMGGPATAPQPQPFGGTLSPEWQSYDVGTGELFAPGYAQSHQSTPSSSFDPHATGPIEAGQIEANMRKSIQMLEMLKAWQHLTY